MNVPTLNYFLSGAATLGYFVAALYFLRFWTRTRDRLFAFFSIAFAIMGLQRIAMIVSAQSDEGRDTILYGLRLFAFLLIIAAIIDKNRSSAR